MELLTYLLKSTAVITLFYLVYVVMLKKDTFFTANRFYLISGIIAAIVLPFITFTSVTFVEAPTIPVGAVNQSSPLLFTEAAPETFSIDWWQVALTIYFVGLIVMITRIIIQLVSLQRLFSKCKSVRKNGFRYIETREKIAPFSFFKTIVYNPNLHDKKELQMILEHEKAHAKQWHSADLLLITIVRAFQWANPITWLYKKALEANLEFLADYETSQKVSSKKQYQLVLVQASSALPVPALTNNFYHSFTRLNVFGRKIKIDFHYGQVKKRIIMLNKNSHTNQNTWKLSIILPLLAVFLWSFNTEEVFEYTTDSTTPEATSEMTTLQFSASSSEAELDAIEVYFSENHPDILLKISDRKRDDSGNLIGFSFKTKFEKDRRFNKRFERKPENGFKTTYVLQYAPQSTLLVDEQGDGGVQLKITADNLQIIDPTLTVQQPQILTPKKSENASVAKEKKEDQDAKNEVHQNENEIVFISEKQRKKSDAPKDVIKKKITKNTTEAELTAMKNSLLNEYGIALTFSTTRNTKKEITAIKIAYTWDDKSGNFNINDPDGIDDFYMVLDKETNHYGFYSDKKHNHTRERLYESNEELFAKRDQLLAQKKEVMEEAHALRSSDMASAKSERKKLLAEAKEIRKEMIEERKELLAEVKDERRELLEERKALIKENYHLDGSTKVHEHEEHTLIITKKTSDIQLAQMRRNLASKGIDFNYKRVRRNSNGEITSIKVTVDNNNGNEVIKSIKTDDGSPIDPIHIKM